MRTQLMVAVSLLVVALAGCSDPPPSGELTSGSSTPAASQVDGTATTEYQSFNNPYQQSSGTEAECEQDQIIDEDPTGQAPVEECQRPYTKVSGHISSLPDAGANGFKAFFVDSAGTNPDLEIDMTENTTGMYDLSFDNSGDCQTASSDEGCNLEGAYDQIVIRAETSPEPTPIAVAPAGGGDFAIHPALTGLTFDLTYDGKDVVLTLNGGNSTISYQAIFYDEVDGAVTPVEDFPVSPGENEITLEADGDTYEQVHIHVAGTAINLAVAAPA